MESSDFKIYGQEVDIEAFHLLKKAEETIGVSYIGKSLDSFTATHSLCNRCQMTAQNDHDGYTDYV